MDPITAAVVSALPIVMSDIVKTSVKDAYEGLKRLLIHKFGQSSEANHALSALEANPASKADTAVLAESVAAARATEDAEIMKAIASLLKEIKEANVSTPGNIYVSVTGGHNEGIVGANIGTVNFGAPRRNS